MYFVCIQTEQHRGDESTLGHKARMPRRGDVSDWKDVSTVGSEDLRIWFPPGKLGSFGWLTWKEDL
jgi:hypothetical protein